MAQDVRVQIVASSEWLERIDEWCKRQPGKPPNRSVAIRMLVDKGLEASDEPPAKKAKRATK